MDVLLVVIRCIGVLVDWDLSMYDDGEVVVGGRIVWHVLLCYGLWIMDYVYAVLPLSTTFSTVTYSHF